MKIVRKILTGFLFVAILALIPTRVFASRATTYTMTLNAKGEYVRTQDAYLPKNVIINLKLSKPEDMMFDENDHLYIADTGNRRIIKYDTKTNTMVRVFESEEIRGPKGIYVTKQFIYVADSSGFILKYDLEFNLINSYGKPKTSSFEGLTFNPNKLVVDNRGNIYVVSEGMTDGIIQLSNTGEFLGFFASNKIQLTPQQVLYKIIMTESQFEKYARRNPLPFSSIFIDQHSIIYTSTAGVVTNAVKKHNTQGGNILNRTVAYHDARDVYVDQQGIIYAAMESGTIFVYTPTGDFIFSFGANNRQSTTVPDIAGLFTKLSAIAVDRDGVVWGLDIEKFFLQSFKPTDYALNVYKALKLFDERQYDDAITIWSDVLKLNQMSVIAHNNLAKSYLQKQMYEEAMNHFKLAGNKADYSQAYWEVRNNSLPIVLTSVIVGIIVLLVLSKSLKIVDQKTQKISIALEPIKKAVNKKIIKDLLHIFRVIRHPIDSFYEIKKGHRGSILSATILYIIIFLSFIVYNVYQGFIYQNVAIEDVDLLSLMLGFLAVTGLFVVSNYLDTSINDGIGGLKQVYIMFVYALGPLFIAYIVVTIGSHILTYDEVFFLNLVIILGYVISSVNIFLGIMEIHEYRALKVFRSIFMTILFSVIIAIAVILLYMMWQQLYTFIAAVVKEVFRNVFH